MKQLQIQILPNVRRKCCNGPTMFSAHLQKLNQVAQVTLPLQVARLLKLTVSPIDKHIEVAECQLARGPTTCSTTGSL